MEVKNFDFLKKLLFTTLLLIQLIFRNFQQKSVKSIFQKKALNSDLSDFFSLSPHKKNEK